MQIWTEQAPGIANWESLSSFELKRETWYYVSLIADYKLNEYKSLKIQSTQNEHDVLILQDLSAFKIAEETKFDEEAFWLTLEVENQFAGCDNQQLIRDYQLYYDDVTLIRLDRIISRQLVEPFTSDREISVSVSWVDIDNDADLDLFVSDGSSSEGFDDLYINNDGAFSKAQGGDLANDNEESRGIAWGDYDNDGDHDLFVARWSDFGTDERNDALYENNGDGTFSQVQDGDVVTGKAQTWSGSWVDYDNDGDLDLFVTNETALGAFFPFINENFLFRNNGDGDFERITETYISREKLSTKGSTWADYDNDGDQDLFTTNFQVSEAVATNKLYENKRENSEGDQFVPITDTEDFPMVNILAHSWSSSWADYDNDGDLDLFVATTGNKVNALYKNNDGRSFTLIETGDIPKDSSYSFGGSWADYDNDGDLDLYVTNLGVAVPLSRSFERPNFLYRNEGPPNYDLRRLELEEIFDGQPGRPGIGGFSRGLSWGDFDQDGDLDLVVANSVNSPNHLFSNNVINDLPNLYNSNWLNIKLIGLKTNSSAIGARVHLNTEIEGVAIQQMREVSSQTGGLSQNSLYVHFGIGTAETIDQFYIYWPVSGDTQYVEIENINRHLIIAEDIDEDDNGINDYVDGEFPEEFGDGITLGNIVSRGDQLLSIVDAQDREEGLRIVADPTGGPTPAIIEACEGASSIMLTAGDEAIVTCSSVHIRILEGIVEIDFEGANGALASLVLNSKSQITFDPDLFTFEASSDNLSDVI
ncbi:MAG: CRTAC1 family protein, partial [Bacteroidota bacterium]